jgi:hypothetical protein
VARKSEVTSLLVVKTNYAESVAWYRDVAGQLYNTRYSLRFQHVIATVESNYDNSILVGWNTNGGIKTNFDKEILLLNYPTNGMTNGQKLNFRAMQVDWTNFFGNEIEIWDFGTPHIVQTVTTNKVFNLKFTP